MTDSFRASCDEEFKRGGMEGGVVRWSWWVGNAWWEADRDARGTTVCVYLVSTWLVFIFYFCCKCACSAAGQSAR